ncbi:uncharacterized protein LOC130951720 isoform X3 [Arachis stenosperma]|uniref:uncharacterized protein LOC130951720 isoform X3 n=1 Tax=Arachis stenosperma TaxID=217475 RepID=UPI0025ACCFD1|nr:uncharacterized protein LOC130951720 isoform X3 [Arachis stenosperma]
MHMTDSKAYLPFILFVFLHSCSHVLTRELSEGVKYSHKDKGNNLMKHPTLLHDMERGQKHDLVDTEDSTSGETDYYQKERSMVYPMQIKPVEPVQPIPPMDPYPTPPQRPNPEPEQDFPPRHHNNIHTTNYLIGYYQPFITSPMSSTKRDHHTYSKVHQPLSLEDIESNNFEDGHKPRPSADIDWKTFMHYFQPNLLP